MHSFLRRGQCRIFLFHWISALRKSNLLSYPWVRLLLFSLAAVPSGAAATGNSGSINGTVVDATGRGCSQRKG